MLNRKRKVFNMNISKLLSTEERVHILNIVLFKVCEIKVADISKTLKISKGFVSKFLSFVAGEKIIRKYKNKYIINDNLKVRSLRILLNLIFFADFNFSKYHFVRSAGIYGSCAKGENTEDSDIDIWIKIDKRNEEERCDAVRGS